MSSHDYTEEGLRARLSELFEALRITLQGVAEKGGELARHDQVLQMVHEQIGPPLIEETDAAHLSYAATWHLAHLAVALLERTELPDSAVYQPLNSAIRHLNEELVRAQQQAQYRSADGLEGIVDRIARALSDDLVQSLPGPLAAPLSTLLLEDLPAPLAAPLSALLLQDLPGPLAAPLSAQLVQVLPGPLAAPLSAQLVQVLPGPLAAQLVLTLPGPLAVPLSADLIQSLPGPVAQAIVAAIEVVQDKTSEDIAALEALAATPLNTTIKSPADAIGFLQAIRNALEAVDRDTNAVPPDLIQPVTNTVRDVIGVVAETASVDDVNAMNGLKQEIAAILQPPAPAQLARLGGIP